ncbi:Crp/Fnr family transcriptional regulator [Pedobacter miscanthi]|uniref:Crp/Fnr family transcriptional regulator n=1 Tax=Pedobacter miscanthi TaxID=2259170 RepID=A0A366LCA5_9SPHI|nr:Crp/Fnr family transcriptional regulator [Pedobacter miscanthi]RBQ11525.1 Crp/Fnr family transcriptional regulator [Pedobacter miscanthi]
MENNADQATELLAVFSRITPISQPFQQRLCGQLLIRKFPRRHILLRPGEIARNIYFIKEGFLRAYFIDREGRECTTWFMGKYDLMISVYSFFTQQPAHEYIEVLQESTLQSISYLQLQSYYADFREGNLIGRAMMERYYILSEERAIFLRCKTPYERYEQLIRNHPDIIRQTTQINIASYLGIGRETLNSLKMHIQAIQTKRYTELSLSIHSSSRNGGSLLSIPGVTGCHTKPRKKMKIRKILIQNALQIKYPILGIDKNNFME